MATAKVLQKPEIIDITGSTIRIAHPDITKNIRTYLSAPIAASGTAMTVYDNNGFADNDWMVVGEIGDSQSETTDVNGAVTRGQSMTVTNYLTLNHELDAPVTKINARAVKIYGAATDGGSGTIIESIDAITASGRQLQDAFMIQWDKPYTEYTLISTDTSYAYYYVTFTDGTTESAASDYMPSTGVTSSQVQYFINQALDLTGSKLSEKVTRKQCVRWANDAQTAIGQFTYQHPKSGQIHQKDWDFEIADDATTLSISTSVNRYSVSALNMKYPYNKGVIRLQMGTLKPFNKTDIEDMTKMLQDKPYTQVATQAAVGATSLVVDNLVDFSAPTSGTAALNVAGQDLTYTGVTGTTTFTGIPASGTGSITATIEVDDPVWQNNENGFPEYYTIFGGEIILNRPPSASYDGYPVKIKYFKKMTELTEASDTTVVTFTNCFQFYIASMIEQRRQNFERAEMYMQKFNKIVLDNALHHKVPSTDRQEYYRFIDPQDYYGRLDIK